MAEKLSIMGRQKLVVTDHDDDYLKGKIDVTEAGRLFLSVPDEEDWTLYVDGVKTDYTEFKDSFVSVDLPAGTHEIYLKFTPVGQKLGILMTLIGIAIFSAACRILSHSGRAYARRKADSSAGLPDGN